MSAVASFRKNAREEVRISLDDFKGHTLANVRVWFDDGTEMRPGKQGLAIRAELLPDLISALGEAACQLEGVRK
jgi:hypothetical protein